MMAPKKPYSHYSFDLYPNQDIFGRPQPVPLDFDRKPLCECGTEFLEWLRRQHVAEVLSSPTLKRLDQALLLLTKEYGYRRQTIDPNDHRFNSCIREVFEELLDLITAKQEELRRHERSGSATLYIGTQEQETNGR